MRQFAFGGREEFGYIYDRITIGAPLKMKYKVVIKNDVTGVLVFEPTDDRKVQINLETDGLALEFYEGQSSVIQKLFDSEKIVCKSVDELIEIFHETQIDYADNCHDSISSSAHNSCSSITETSNDRADEPREIISSAAELASKLKERIIGQDDLIDRMAVCVFNHLRKRHPKKPLTIMLPGPTGVGKTATAKALAEILQGMYGKDKMPFITVNCNTMREEHRISELIGSPAGYVGYGDECLLSPLKRSSSAIICFDELEKAHPGVHLALMNWIDTGKITFAHIGKKDENNGAEPPREYNCSKSIIIMTSNIPTNTDFSTSMRFSISTQAFAQESSISQNDRCRNAMVANGFKPEVAGRIAYFFEYHKLSDEDIKQILLLSFKNKAVEYGIKVVNISESVKADLFGRFGTSLFGVRPLEYALDEILGTQVPSVESEMQAFEVDGTLDSLIFREV